MMLWNFLLSCTLTLDMHFLVLNVSQVHIIRFFGCTILMFNGLCCVSGVRMGR